MATPVLIVDDDTDLRSALTELLEEEGYAVEGAADGRDALAKLRGGLRPALILLDLMMPGMNGWDFRKAQLDDPELRALSVVVVTASGSDPATIRAQLGPVELLAKPIHPKDLLDVVGRLAPLLPLRNSA
jgi:two-component system chemotaxis response regulator CheY